MTHKISIDNIRDLKRVLEEWARLKYGDCLVEVMDFAVTFASNVHGEPPLTVVMKAKENV